ncbi:hypothetical protein SAMN05421770_1011133 [Granulicella rosea]|uniref:Uncharacterized protein n=1 Tax=Granulicella rosea TaxID=474952 RepID=A0A239ES73_9BACT|nr:hypothetical protein [Granulicella rosea]SNS47536.1 hypothetical protein SAMN05421770_1011133 [Granulicella rosea]
MKRYGFFKAVKFLVFIAIVAFALGYVTMHLWNWLMPAIFGLTRITWFQAVGLLLLSKLFFSGIHHHGGGRRHWKNHMKERWVGMSEEERERFRAGMRGRGCGPFGRRREAPAETPVAR